MSDRKYPSILELALKAGKWSVIAGSSAVIIGGAGCAGSNEVGQDIGLPGNDVHVSDLPEQDVQDVWYEPDYLPGIIVYVDALVDEGTGVLDITDVPVMEAGGTGDFPDEGIDEVINPDSIVVDADDQDPGLMGDDVSVDNYQPSDIIDTLHLVDVPDVAISADTVVDD